MPPADPGAPRLSSNSYILRIRQHPMRGKVLGKDKDRKPIDPPPVVQLFVRDPSDPAQNYLQSPYFWMAATIWHEKEDKPLDDGHQALTGALTSSLHRLKDMDSQGQSRDGGFFVFGDLSCKLEGKYRLKLALYECLQGCIQCLAEVITQPFEVYNTKNFPGMQESTFMSRSFGDQGVRLRIRKESRQLMKRPASSYSPGQTHPSVPAGAYPGQPGYPPGMTNAYSQGYIKSEDGLDEHPAKRQRSANTSPTNYIERGSYGSLAPQAYNQQAYADPTYASNLAATSMGMSNSNLLQQSPVAAFPGRTHLGFDGSQQDYSYADGRQYLPMHNARTTDPNSNAAYATAGYPTAYSNGSAYASYNTNGGMANGYTRPAGS